jgi:hypothetical protein
MGQDNIGPINPPKHVKLLIEYFEQKMVELLPLLAQTGTHSEAFYQAIELSVGLLAIMAVLGWIWLRDELKEKE